MVFKERFHLEYKKSSIIIIRVIDSYLVVFNCPASFAKAKYVLQFCALLFVSRLWQEIGLISFGHVYVLQILTATTTIVLYTRQAKLKLESQRRRNLGNIDKYCQQELNTCPATAAPNRSGALLLECSILFCHHSTIHGWRGRKRKLERGADGEEAIVSFFSPPSDLLLFFLPLRKQLVRYFFSGLLPGCGSLLAPPCSQHAWLVPVPGPQGEINEITLKLGRVEDKRGKWPKEEKRERRKGN